MVSSKFPTSWPRPRGACCPALMEPVLRFSSHLHCPNLVRTLTPSPDTSPQPSCHCNLPHASAWDTRITQRSRPPSPEDPSRAGRLVLGTARAPGGPRGGGDSHLPAGTRGQRSPQMTSSVSPGSKSVVQSLRAEEPVLTAWGTSLSRDGDEPRPERSLPPCVSQGDVSQGDTSPVPFLADSRAE